MKRFGVLLLMGVCLLLVLVCGMAAAAEATAALPKTAPIGSTIKVPEAPVQALYLQTHKESTASDTSPHKPRETSKNAYNVGDTMQVNVTHYCACAKCNGSDCAGLDALGKPLRAGTIACNVLPLGSRLWIDGKTYTVRNRLAKGDDSPVRIDIYIPEGHSDAQELGRLRGVDVTIHRVGWLNE